MSKKYLYISGAVSLAVVGALSYNYFSTDKNFIKNAMPPSAMSLSELLKKIHYTNPGHAVVNEIKNQAMRDELTVQDIKKEVLIPMMDAISRKEVSKIDNLFKSNQIKITGLPAALISSSESFDEIKSFAWEQNIEAAISTNEILKQYVENFVAVDDIRFDITSYYIDEKERQEKNAEAKVIKLSGFFDMRGKDTEKALRNDRSPIEISLVKESNLWKIETINFIKGESLVSQRAPAFTEVTHNIFSPSAPAVHLRREAIRRGGYALAVTDYNNDGISDLYIGGAESSNLYKGSKNGVFELFSQNSLSKETMVKTAIFADFNNDGFQDLFVTSFTHNESEGDLVVYKGSGENGFERMGDPGRKLGRLNSYEPMPATTGDFDNDGLLDVYVGFPGRKDFTHTYLSGNEVIGGSKEVQGIFLNSGDLNFKQKNLQYAELDSDQSYRKYLYPHSAMAIDWNRDHKSDIVVIDDQDNLSPIFINKGSAEFDQVAEKIGVSDSANAMSFAAADFNNDGLIDFAMSSANLFTAQRYNSALDKIWSEHETKMGFGGKAVRLFIQSKNQKFTDVTSASGLDYAGEGAAGIEFIDYNNDGLLDLYVTNGLWSGNDKNQEASHILMFSKIKEQIRESIFHDKANITQSAFMSWLVDFRGDLFKNNYSGNKSMSAGGYQRNRLFRNKGDGTFTDVAYIEGIDSINDGYLVAKADLFGNGRNDIILRNGDPGNKEYTFPAVQIFKNNFAENNGLRIKLIGKNGNLDAIGTGVTVESNGKKFYQQVIGNNGPAQSERTLHFGIGKSLSVDKVTIHWNSGDQILRNLKSGTHIIEELPGKKISHNN